MIANDILNDCLLDQLRNPPQRKLSQLWRPTKLYQLRAAVPPAWNSIFVDVFIQHIGIFGFIHSVLTIDLIRAIEEVSEEKSLK